MTKISTIGLIFIQLVLGARKDSLTACVDFAVHRFTAVDSHKEQ